MEPLQTPEWLTTAHHIMWFVPQMGQSESTDKPGRMSSKRSPSWVNHLRRMIYTTNTPLTHNELWKTFRHEECCLFSLYIVMYILHMSATVSLNVCLSSVYLGGLLCKVLCTVKSCIYNNFTYSICVFVVFVGVFSRRTTTCYYPGQLSKK